MDRPSVSWAKESRESADRSGIPVPPLKPGSPRQVPGGRGFRFSGKGGNGKPAITPGGEADLRCPRRTFRLDRASWKTTVRLAGRTWDERGVQRAHRGIEVAAQGPGNPRGPARRTR